MLGWSSREEIPHAQGKRNPSKMVGVARGHQRADALKPYSQKSSQPNHTRTTALSNSMKPSHAHGATQDGRVMVERSGRMWSTGEGNGKPLHYSCLENPMNSMKRQNDRILKEELPRSVKVKVKVKVKSLSRVRLFATPWTVAYQAPPSMRFSRQECWSVLPFPTQGSNPGLPHCRQMLTV